MLLRRELLSERKLERPFSSCKILRQQDLSITVFLNPHATLEMQRCSCIVVFGKHIGAKVTYSHFGGLTIYGPQITIQCMAAHATSFYERLPY